MYGVTDHGKKLPDEKITFLFFQASFDLGDGSAQPADNPVDNQTAPETDFDAAVPEEAGTKRPVIKAVRISSYDSDDVPLGENEETQVSKL